MALRFPVVNVSQVTAPVVGAGNQFFAGARLFARGVGLCFRNPRLMLLGMIPALITGVLYLAAFVALAWNVVDLAAWLTPFADDWSAAARSLTRVVAGAAVFGVGLLVGVLTFTTVTLVIGDPFYESISGRIERGCGGTPDEVETSFWTSLGRAIVDALRLIGLSVLFGVLLFIAGFIPILGQTVVPVLGAIVGGGLLALELTGSPFSRRGKLWAERRQVLRRNRTLALGFGVSVFVVFLIPLGAILFMPAAVVGAALLTRRCLGQRIPDQIVVAPKPSSA